MIFKSKMAKTKLDKKQTLERQHMNQRRAQQIRVSRFRHDPLANKNALKGIACQRTVIT